MLGARLARGGLSLTVATLAAVSLALAVAACSADPPAGGVGPIGPVGEEEGIPGSGDLVSEVRDVAGFHSILLAGEGTVVVSLGGTESLTVETDGNLLPYIESNVVAGRLEVGTAPGVDIAPTRSVSYRVSAADLSELALSGAGAILISDWRTEEASLLLSGAGDIGVDGLTATSLEVEHVGVGTISATGSVDGQTVLVAGVGDYDGARLRSRVASVETRDAGAATVWVTDELDVAVSPQGSVSYYGSAPVTPEDPAGTVTHLGDK